uniref:SCP domain-containing protein n=1 Tax=Romanomermis culicivorax TaxID=13658 RepID=A0A915LB67_ROMCU
MNFQLISMLAAYVLTKIVEANKPRMHGLTRDEKIEILTAHNMFRRRVRENRLHGQPPGVIGDLKWSDELTKFAYYFIDEYIKQHGECPNYHSPDSCWYRGNKVEKVGENINYGTPSPEEAVRVWFDEHVNYRFSRAPGEATPPNAMIGHYTQLVWGRTKQIGCAAAANCMVNGTHYDMMLLCNYWPAGNTDGEYPYYTTHNPEDWADWYASYNDTCRWTEYVADNWDVEHNILKNKVKKPYHDLEIATSAQSLYDELTSQNLQELVCNVIMSPSANEIVTKLRMQDFAKDCLEMGIGHKPIREKLNSQQAFERICNYIEILAEKENTTYNTYMKEFCDNGYYEYDN